MRKILIVFVVFFPVFIVAQIQDAVYLSDGSVINDPDDFDFALLLASEENRLDDIKKLIKAGANVNYQSDNGSSALHIAAEKSNIEILNYLLLNFANPNIKDVMGVSPLHTAITLNHLSAMEVLLNYKADPNLQDNFNRSPLIYAAYYGNINTIELLLSAKADLYLTDEDSTTVLHYAVFYNKSDVVKAILELGFDVNVKNNAGSTPLMFAAQENHYELCKFLLEKGADPSIRNNDGFSAIAYAIKNNHLDVVKLFDVFSYDLELPEKANYNLLEIAQDNNLKSIVNYLSSKGLKKSKGIRINQFSASVYSDFNARDLMSGLEMGFVENIQNIEFGTGFMTRFRERRVLTVIEEQHYQLFEQRNYFYVYAEKKFFIDDIKRFAIGIRIKEGISVYHYSGFEYAEKPAFIFSPELNVLYKYHHFGVYISYEYFDTKALDFGNSRFKIGLKTFLDFGAYRIKNKDFEW